MSVGRVRVEVVDHVAEVTLDRPEKHNALNGAMFAGIAAAVEQVAATPGVRAVVLRGEGPSFCAGIDLASLGADDQVEDIIRRPADHRANAAQRACTDWIDLPIRPPRDPARSAGAQRRLGSAPS